ncbi:hypothetical protein [Chrysiogenes arsenatis]|uniref:hypothetical protein n=1 Tax=Chrysiogenes arsenatis TaxID=309797 RepID=UPI00041A147A|nr:hypothetical protein [Chrysiogenes arsenatis]
MEPLEKQKLHKLLRDIIGSVNSIQSHHRQEMERIDKKIEIIMFILRQLGGSERVERMVRDAKFQLGEFNLGSAFHTEMEREFQRLERWVNDVCVLEGIYQTDAQSSDDGNSNSPKGE